MWVRHPRVPCPSGLALSEAAQAEVQALIEEESALAVQFEQLINEDTTDVLLPEAQLEVLRTPTPPIRSGARDPLCTAGTLTYPDHPQYPKYPKHCKHLDTSL